MMQRMRTFVHAWWDVEFEGHDERKENVIDTSEEQIGLVTQRESLGIVDLI